MISVCIPCIPFHEKYLHHLLESIKKQTVIPNEVIIAYSSINTSIQNEKETLFKNKFPELNLVFSFSSSKCFAGENRNRGGELCTSKYITFMDADDLMKEDKIEILIDVLSNNDIDALIHTYGNGNGSGKLINNEIIKDIRNKINTPYLHSGKLGATNSIHHGHITVKKDIFDIYKQSNIQYAQDCEYVNRLINNNIKLFLLDRNLSIYRHLFTSKNEFK